MIFKKYKKVTILKKAFDYYFDTGSTGGYRDAEYLQSLISDEKGQLLSTKYEICGIIPEDDKRYISVLLKR